MRMDLDAYLRAGPQTAVDLAQQTGISEASISRIRKGGQNVTRDVMHKIAVATRGAVMPNDFIDLADLDHADDANPHGPVQSPGNMDHLSGAEVAA